jgi:hypothetical protein
MAVLRPCCLDGAFDDLEWRFQRKNRLHFFCREASTIRVGIRKASKAPKGSRSWVGTLLTPKTFKLQIWLKVCVNMPEGS